MYSLHVSDYGNWIGRALVINIVNLKHHCYRKEDYKYSPENNVKEKLSSPDCTKQRKCNHQNWESIYLYFTHCISAADESNWQIPVRFQWRFVLVKKRRVAKRPHPVYAWHILSRMRGSNCYWAPKIDHRLLSATHKEVQINHTILLFIFVVIESWIAHKNGRCFNKWHGRKI